MKIVIAPGAFKNSLRAEQVAEAIETGLRRSGLRADFHRVPIADGGNGTLDAFLARGGQRITLKVDNPTGQPVEAAYGLIDNGKTAVIEMAQASGLELLTNWQLNPLLTSTYGTGQLMRDALSKGVERIIIGMGGSATVDGGAGCLQAIGVGLYDAYGQSVPRGGGHLDQIFIIDSNSLDRRWQKVEILIAADVDNPALGQHGAAAIFGPQKGANPQQVGTLEKNLSHFFTLIHNQLGKDVRTVPGGGAAGAFSAGLMAFLNARIESGIDLMLHHSGFAQHMRGATLVVTGEGRMDSQTIHGKGPLGVAQAAKSYKVPTVALVGSLAEDDQILHQAGIHAVLPIITEPMSLEAALENAAHLVEQAALRLGYLLQIQHKG